MSKQNTERNTSFSTVEQSSDTRDRDYKSQTFNRRDLILRSKIIAVMINC